MKEQIHAQATGQGRLGRVAPAAIHPGRELRIAITWKCNFSCQFCHHEGMDGPAGVRASGRPILELIKAEIARGCDDVTLTGGEPLLEKAVIGEVVRGLAELPALSRPALTIVSNGSCWDAETIRLLSAYPGPCKVNISMHTAEPGKYDSMTGSRDQRERVLKTIVDLVAEGVVVKLNAVILRGVNASREDLAGLIDLASRLGVKHVKFLELLKGCGNEQDHRYFVGSDEIEAELTGMGYRRIREVLRGVDLVNDNPGSPSIEIKRCSCALGCGRCRETLGRNYGPDLKYQPCFRQRAEMQQEMKEVA
jgi:molybdenum cofactor biosynthesis enzyme MoaA